LLRFTAERNYEGVLIEWITGSEQATTGFHLYRSETGDQRNAQRITQQRIAARGSAASGASYMWLDERVIVRVVYTYWLEEYEYTGETRLYGPIQVRTPQAAAQVRLYVPMILR
jgi:hypothetical protein